MATIKELMDDPAKMSEADLENFKSLINKVQELTKSLEGYNIDIESSNTPDVIASRFYIEHFIMAAILEAFMNENTIKLNALNISIFKYVPKEFVEDIPVAYINTIIAKMIRLGFIEFIETGNKYSPQFKITEKGVEALEKQTFQNLASSSFFNYQTHLLNEKLMKMNKRSIGINILMLIVTITSVVVTIATLISNR